MARKATPSKYKRVYAKLVERIRTGQWQPGQRIPNEFEIADEFHVSQGTARKALGVLAADKLLVRRQGRGTFVFDYTADEIRFRFFNLFDDSGARIIPRNHGGQWTVGRANRSEQVSLGLRKNARVLRMNRLRVRGSKPFITESLTLPERNFPDLAELPEIPDTFYPIFQKSYGVLVTRTDERVTAVTADAKAAKELDIPAGTPLMRIERIAYALDDRPVEWRVSLCHLERAHYRARTG
jgi:GntR family transcriptional regulator